MAASQDQSAAQSSTPAASTSAAASTSTPVPTAGASSSTPEAPSSSSTVKLPVRDKDSFKEYTTQRYIERDWAQAAAMIDKTRGEAASYRTQNAKLRDYRLLHQNRHAIPSRVLYGPGYSGYGNGFTDNGGPTRLLYPHQKPRPGRRMVPQLSWKKKDMKQQAEQHEELVPVRLDVDWDKLKLRDTFTWNLHERIISPELFAATLMEDLGLKDAGQANRPVFEQVLHQIREQLNDFYPFAFSEEDALDPELPYSAYKNDEMRILIKLNVTIGMHTLVDQFEWDINNPLNSPEDFAASMAQDLSLSGEFATAIAHCIREQTQLFTRSLYSVGHPFDGRPIEDPDLVAAMLPSPLTSVFRPQQQAKEYAPYLYEMSEQDMERTEHVFSREQRRQRRGVNRRGGPVLPDLKERQRTIRTLLVSSVLPGAAANMDETRLYKRATGTVLGRKRGAGHDGGLSDSDDSEDSGPDSPALSQLQGTARTRGMRGAASAAQQRMANLGRSETPEATILHHHETRTSSRRFGPQLLREDTEEPPERMVTLKVKNRERLSAILRGARPSRHTPSGSQTPSAQPRAPSAPAPGAMGPPSTPRTATPGITPRPPSTIPAGQYGRIPAPPPPPPGQPAPTPPPPPDWLVACLKKMQESYPDDSFEGTMRYCTVDAETEQPLPPNAADRPASVKYMYFPRIRCRDCPGKLYTPGPELTAGNFEVHLKNNKHRQQVDLRVGRPTGPPAARAGSVSSASGPS